MQGDQNRLARPEPGTKHDSPQEARADGAELDARCERLAPNHPSSPHTGDGGRKPPVPDPFRGELPLPGELGTPADQAVLGEHKPQVGTDGSWEWKGRRLTPDESRIADQTLARCLAAEGRDADGNYGDHGLTPAMRRIEAQLEHGHLVDRTEEFALKSPDRFKEKLAERLSFQPDEPVTALADRIHDGIRYTFAHEQENYTKGFWEAESALQENGYELILRKPSWESTDYKGVNSQWRDTESGCLFEVQFHTPASWDAKQTTHAAYERLADPRTSAEERVRLDTFQREVTSSVPVPPRALEIPYFRKEGT